MCCTILGKYWGKKPWASMLLRQVGQWIALMPSTVVRASLLLSTVRVRPMVRLAARVAFSQALLPCARLSCLRLIEAVAWVTPSWATAWPTALLWPSRTRAPPLVCYAWYIRGKLRLVGFLRSLSGSRPRALVQAQWCRSPPRERAGSVSPHLSARGL